MGRGPRTPEGIARVTETIRWVNILGLNRPSMQRPGTRATVTQILAMLEGAGRTYSRSTHKVTIELLAMILRHLGQIEDHLDHISRVLSAVSSRLSGAKEIGKPANVRATGQRKGQRSRAVSESTS